MLQHTLHNCFLPNVRWSWLCLSLLPSCRQHLVNRDSCNTAAISILTCKLLMKSNSKWLLVAFWLARMPSFPFLLLNWRYGCFFNALASQNAVICGTTRYGPQRKALQKSALYSLFRSCTQICLPPAVWHFLFLWLTLHLHRKYRKERSNSEIGEGFHRCKTRHDQRNGHMGNLQVLEGCMHICTLTCIYVNSLQSFLFLYFYCTLHH